MKIAIGNSKETKFWSNKAMSFEEFCAQVRTPVRTSETVEEYHKLSRVQRDAIKNKGGFVGGHLEKGRRTARTVACRSMLTLDLDNATPEFVANMKETLKYKCVGYSTHGHTPEAPRLRLVIPLAHDIPAEQYPAVSRYVAAGIGIEMVDPCSFVVHQLMHWPTCAINGEYLCIETNGDLLDPDAILAAHPEWTDYSQLPTTPKESKAAVPSDKKPEDPLTKRGVIGTFCRTYSISAAIDAFLSDVYEPAAVDDRYTYIPGEGSAGVLLYDDIFAYSFHATDPASGKLLNAFDLVRIHKFGDEKPSVPAMLQFASNDPKVKVALLDERKKQAAADFDDDWREHLDNDKNGNLYNSVKNELLILNNDPDFAGFAFNEMANKVQVTGSVPWARPQGNKFWRDGDTAQLKAILDTRYGVFSSRNHEVSFTKVAEDRHFHPVRDYLASLPPWDSTKRIETLLIQYLQADNTEYVKAVTRKTLVAAVARAIKPGSKFDSILVLDGVQGIGKSTLFKDIAGEEYYSETLSLTDMNDKAGAEKLQGFWIVEIAELAGMKKADIEKVKAFISTADDCYRPSYGRTVESHPRQCVIIASVNGERGYLRDITGNRRFWVVKLHQTEQKKSWAFSPQDRAQIWAEAKQYYSEGEKLYLEGELIAEAEHAQRTAMESDERAGMVETYLETLLPDGWKDMDLPQRIEFLRGPNDPTQPRGVHRREQVCNAEIWCECFERKLSEMKTADSYAIASLMSQIEGWAKEYQRAYVSRYGRQRVYCRTLSSDMPF